MARIVLEYKAALIRGYISPRTLSGPVKHSGWLQGDKEPIITTARECARGVGYTDSKQ